MRSIPHTSRMLPGSQSLPLLKTSRSHPHRLQPALLRRFRRLLSRSSPEAVCTGLTCFCSTRRCRSKSLVPTSASFSIPFTFFKRTTLSRMASGTHRHRTWKCLVLPTPVREHIPIAAVESVSTSTLMVRPISFVHVLREASSC